MRHVYHTISVLILAALCACNTEVLIGNGPEDYIRDFVQKRKEKDRYVLSEGIIGKDLIKDFKGLDYYAPDTSYRVNARIERLEPVKVIFKTNTERSPEYFTFARLRFRLGDSTCELTAYASDAFAREGLFIPFKDLSNQTETYGGGRYLDLKYNGETDYLTIDFNEAYNPYCHYNHDYSCPLVPAENRLKTTIAAGEKKLY